MEILNALLYVIKRGDAVIKVTGEVGSGKTTLLRLVALELPRAYRLVYITTPNLSSKDLLVSIAEDLGIIVNDLTTKYQILKLIHDALFHFYAQNQKVVLLVDEAQAMSVDTLEELRLLTNLETDQDKLIQLVIFGQQELDLALNKSELRQLKSRITYSIHIPTLSVNDVYNYLNYRMRMADYHGLDFFKYKHAKRIHLLSHGLPRTINAIADQLLMAAFGVGDKQLKNKHFKNINISDFEPSRQGNGFFAFIVMGLLVLSMALIVLFLLKANKVDFFVLQNVDEQNKELQLPMHTSSQSVTAAPLKSDKTKTFGSLEPNEQFLEIETVSRLEELVLTDKTSLATTATQKNSQFIASGHFDTSVSDLFQFGELVALHKETVRWLDQLDLNGYVIQLSTISVSSYNELINSYTYKNSIQGDVHFMLVLNKNETKVALQSLYVSDLSYKKINKVLKNLPESIRISEPFIVNVSTLRERANMASQKLKVMDIQ